MLLGLDVSLTRLASGLVRQAGFDRATREAIHPSLWYCRVVYRDNSLDRLGNVSAQYTDNSFNLSIQMTLVFSPNS